MKIILVNHTFLPESCAGSELCVYHLAKAYQERGHDAAVFYRIGDHSLDEYALLEGEYDGIPVCRINRTYRYVEKFQDIYLDPIVAARFSTWLRDQRADIVHFHHLTNLSVSLVHEAKQQGCAVIMTLHDYWLLCQRGQLLRPGLTLCDGPAPAKCRACLAPQLLRGRAQRILARAHRMLAVNHRTPPLLNLLDLRRAESHTSNPDFIQRSTFGLGEAEGEVLLMHPPARVDYRLPQNVPARFRAAIAMHPSTYDREGAGVRFLVKRGEEILFSRLLRPKQVEADRGWQEAAIDLPESPYSEDRLTLATEAEDGVGAFCTAGWKAPRVEALAIGGASRPAATQTLRTIVKRMAATVLQPLAHLFPEAHEGVSHRRNWTQRVFDEVDLFVAPSQFLFDFFVRNGLPQDKVVYSDYGFPDAPPARPRPLHEPLRFGFIGVWLPSKGVDLAIQAFRDVDPNRAELWVYGFFSGYDGYENFEETLRSMAGPAVKFKNRYAPGEVYSILNEFDCLIVPSIWWENSPMTIHEAFQAGVPLITADAGGMAELIRDGGGLTFRMRDAASLREVVRSVIETPSILDELRASIPPVKAIADQADEYLEFFERALRKRSPQ